MKNQWSDNLRKRMERHQEASSEGLWEDIERIIQKEHSIKPLSTSGKIMLWSKRIGAVAAIVIIALVLGYYVSDQSKESMQLAIEIPQIEYPSETKIITPKLQTDLIEKNNSLSSSQKPNTEKLIPSKEISPIDTTNFIKKEEIKTTNEIVKDKTTDSNSCSNQVQDKHIYSKSNKSSGAEPPFKLHKNKQKDHPRWSTNIYASNLFSGSTNRYNGYGNLGSSEMHANNNEEGEPGKNPYGNILNENQYREVYTDIKHKQPITIGISVNYNLDEKWSITSGVTYAILSSELQSGSNNYYYNSEQTLHNVGIPLNINYNIWKNKKLSLYLSGGCHIEKNVSGKLTTDYIVANKLESTKKDNLLIDQLQWSLNTSAGIQYNLSENTGLYIAPGVSYYFKNKSEIETIYKEKPFNISLRLGVSFSFGS